MKNFLSMFAKISLVLTVAAVYFGYAPQRADAFEGGTLTVCTMYVDTNGTIVSGPQNLRAGQFSLSVGTTTSVDSSLVATTNFNALSFNPNQKLLSMSYKNAECVPYLVPWGTYYYKAETITNADPSITWKATYNDEFQSPQGATNPFASINDAHPYSSQLFDANPANDASADYLSDGKAILDPDHPWHMIVVVNTMTPRSSTCHINSFTADNNTPAYGTETTLRFSLSDAFPWTITLLTGSNRPSPSSGTDVSRAIQTGNLTEYYTYRLTCGSDMRDVTIIPFYPPPSPVTVVATAITCKSESDLPNWALGDTHYITSTTASDFVRTHANCSYTPNWNFQWGWVYGAPGYPGDFVGPAATGTEYYKWKDFPRPTNAQGVTQATISNYVEMDQPALWIREVLPVGYLPFSYPGTNSNISPELLCHSNGVNYDNFDFVGFPLESNGIYYCVAFNTTDKTDLSGVRSGSDGAPQITLSANPPSGAAPLTTQLTWSVANGATSCDALNGWSGQKSPSGGSETVSDIIAPTTFTLVCANAFGSNSASVSIAPSVPGAFYLNVNKTYGGSVRTADGLISCGTVCAANYPQNTSVTLIAQPDSTRWRFVGWTGACSGSGMCTINLDSQKTVSAVFRSQLLYQEF